MLTSTASNAIGDAIAGALGAAGILLILGWLIGIGILMATVALITWTVKKVWFWEPRNKRNIRRYYGNDWNNNQQRHNQRNDYYNSNYTPPSDRPWYPTGWAYNPETNLWESPEQQKQKPKQQTYEEWKAAREKDTSK